MDDIYYNRKSPLCQEGFSKYFKLFSDAEIMENRIDDVPRHRTTVHFGKCRQRKLQIHAGNILRVSVFERIRRTVDMFCRSTDCGILSGIGNNRFCAVVDLALQKQTFDHRA